MLRCCANVNGFIHRTAILWECVVYGWEWLNMPQGMIGAFLWPDLFYLFILWTYGAIANVVLLTVCLLCMDEGHWKWSLLVIVLQMIRIGLLSAMCWEDCDRGKGLLGFLIPHWIIASGIIGFLTTELIARLIVAKMRYHELAPDNI